MCCSEGEWLEHERPLPVQALRLALCLRTDQEQTLQQSVEWRAGVHHVHALHRQVCIVRVLCLYFFFLTVPALPRSDVIRVVA